MKQNVALLEVRALSQENRQLKAEIMAIRAAFDRQNFMEKILAAALTGACSKFDDPKEAADYALAAQNAVIEAIEQQVLSQEAESPAQEQPDASPA